MTLDKLEVGEEAMILAINGKSSLRRHLLSMGCLPKTIVKLNRTAPFNDPIEIKLRGYLLSLRVEDAKNIEILKV